MDNSRTADVINRLLDAMQSLEKEAVLLDAAGIQTQSIMNAIDILWDCIKKALGMPEEGEFGTWISDYWYNMVHWSFEGLIARDEAVRKLINWQSES